MNAALCALNRFGLGARPGEQGRLRDPRGWLRAQLAGDSPIAAAPATATPTAISDAIRAFRMPAQANRRQRPQAQPPQQSQPPQPRQQARRRLVEIAGAEALAALETRVITERPFVERLVAFWSNHLCVSTAAKVLVVPLAGSYEREAIRPHVLGRFEEMVLASAKHPAMLVYLDNFQSIGPNSRGAARRRGRGARGLNENYARELLELHTLGVDGGYTQQDVEELAKILTGWTVTGLQDGGPTPLALRSRTRFTSRVRERFLASATRTPAPHRANVSSAICAAIRQPRDSSPRNSSRTSSPTLRPPLRSTVSPRSFAPQTVICARSPRRSSTSRKRGATRRGSSVRRRTGSWRRCARSALERSVR